MAQGAVWSTSAAVIRQLAPDGAYDAAYKDGVLYNMTPKESSLEGLPWRIAVNNEGTQGKGGTVADALSNLYASNLAQFQVQNSSAQPYEYFTTARVKGSVLRGAQKSGASVVDVWDLEMKNSTKAAHMMHSIYEYGDGTGALGVISGGSTVSSTSITLATIQDIVNFSLNQQIQLAITAGGAIRAGTIRITGIDRVAGTLTFAAALNASIPAAATTDVIVNAGDYNVPSPGLASWIGSSATLYGLTRTADPVKFGGNTYSGAGVPPQEALMNLSALIETFGEQGDLFVCNNKKLMDFKKLIEGKVQYTRTEVKSKTAGIGYKALEFEGTNGTIRILGDRFCPYSRAYVLNMDGGFKYKSFGPLVQVLDFDSNDFLRDATDDSYTVRNGSYYVNGIDGNCVSQGVITSFMG